MEQVIRPRRRSMLDRVGRQGRQGLLSSPDAGASKASDGIEHGWLCTLATCESTACMYEYVVLVLSLQCQVR